MGVIPWPAVGQAAGLLANILLPGKDLGTLSSPA
jgi:hypothetical protein